MRCCRHCGQSLDALAPQARYCDARCRRRGFRRRRAGLPEDVLVEGGHRGSVPLDALTTADVRRLLLPVR